MIFKEYSRLFSAFLLLASSILPQPSYATCDDAYTQYLDYHGHPQTRPSYLLKGFGLCVLSGTLVAASLTDWPQRLVDSMTDTLMHYESIQRVQALLPLAKTLSTASGRHAWRGTFKSFSFDGHQLWSTWMAEVNHGRAELGLPLFADADVAIVMNVLNEKNEFCSMPDPDLWDASIIPVRNGEYIEVHTDRQALDLVLLYLNSEAASVD